MPPAGVPIRIKPWANGLFRCEAQCWQCHESKTFFARDERDATAYLVRCDWVVDATVCECGTCADKAEFTMMTSSLRPAETHVDAGPTVLGYFPEGTLERRCSGCGGFFLTDLVDKLNCGCRKKAMLR